MAAHPNENERPPGRLLGIARTHYMELFLTNQLPRFLRQPPHHRTAETLYWGWTMGDLLTHEAQELVAFIKLYVDRDPVSTWDRIHTEELLLSPAPTRYRDYDARWVVVFPDTPE